jgi:hypothetical protein
METKNIGKDALPLSKNLSPTIPTIQIIAHDTKTIDLVNQKANHISNIFSAEEEKVIEQKVAERNMAEILVAERSMKTNAIVGGWLCLFLFIQIVVVPQAFRNQVAVIVGSITRAALPSAHFDNNCKFWHHTDCSVTLLELFPSKSQHFFHTNQTRNKFFLI